MYDISNSSPVFPGVFILLKSRISDKDETMIFIGDCNDCTNDNDDMYICTSCELLAWQLLIASGLKS